MLLRVGVMFCITGLTFIGMGWLGAIGPLLVILGAGCSATALETRLNIEDWQRMAPAVVAAEPEDSGRDQAA